MSHIYQPKPKIAPEVQDQLSSQDKYNLLEMFVTNDDVLNHFMKLLFHNDQTIELFPKAENIKFRPIKDFVFQSVKKNQSMNKLPSLRSIST